MSDPSKDKVQVVALHMHWIKGDETEYTAHLLDTETYSVAKIGGIDPKFNELISSGTLISFKDWEAVRHWLRGANVFARFDPSGKL